ncbi:MAG: TIGR00730 family Rossman fold protein [Micavibrio sp.]|nr:TIGR00730 family Rossman fold protein [Micavibrio sp.]
MANIKAVSVFCGTATAVDPAYNAAAVALGQALAAAKVTLVYGGAELGLMGLVAHACFDAGGTVIGIIPDFQMDRELLNPKMTETHIVETMHDRKRLMAEKCDGFVVLPGGFGTLDEAFEALTWKYIGLHDKPVVFVDTNGFYQPLLKTVEHMIATGFSKSWHRNLFTMVATAAEVLPALESRPARQDADLSRI